MQYSNNLSFVYDDLIPDDVDMLFEQLQPVEPPPSLITRILAQASAHTPPYPFSESPIQPDRFDNWIARKTTRTLC